MIIVTEKVLNETVAAIVQEMDPDQSDLLGSYACGEARPDANIDLLIRRFLRACSEVTL